MSSTQVKPRMIARGRPGEGSAVETDAYPIDSTPTHTTPSADESDTEISSVASLISGKRSPSPLPPLKRVPPSPLVTLWFTYLHFLETHPISTKSLSAAFLSVVADLISQLLLLYPLAFSLHHVNPQSLFHQFLIGLFVRGPWCHWWYEFLDWLFTKLGYVGKKAQESWTVAIGKVVLDQTTFGVFFTWIYFYAIGVLEGQTLDEMNKNASSNLWNVLVANWKVWPLVNVLNFKFVPPALRVLFGNIVSIFWLVYLISVTK